MNGNGSKGLVLVTGGAGYVGCELVPVLLDAGYRVRVFDVMFYGDAGLDRLGNRIEVVEGDIRSIPTGLLDGVTAVINLAGLSTEPAAEYRPEANHAINFRAAVELAAFAKQKKVKRFVQASSGSIYDVGAGHPEKTSCILRTRRSSRFASTPSQNVRRKRKSWRWRIMVSLRSLFGKDQSMGTLQGCVSILS